MTDTLRIGQIGIAHTHATKLVDPPSRALLTNLGTELVGVHEPDRKMFTERSDRTIWQGTRWIDNPQVIIEKFVDSCGLYRDLALGLHRMGPSRP